MSVVQIVETESSVREKVENENKLITHRMDVEVCSLHNDKRRQRQGGYWSSELQQEQEAIILSWFQRQDYFFFSFCGPTRVEKNKGKDKEIIDLADDFAKTYVCVAQQE